MQKHTEVPAETVRVPDRRLDVRYVGPVNGCYTISDRNQLDGQAVEVFACRTLSISASAAAIHAPVLGKVGDRVTARLDGLGILRGRIERPIDGGFVFQILGSDAQRVKLARAIDWLKRRSVLKRNDKRGSDRFQPRDPRSTLTLPDGETQRCFIIDLSRGGAALSMNYRPEIGTALVVGSLACKVVRYVDHGFAVQFDALQDEETVEQLVCGHVPRPEQDGATV